jgi:hypothetical protein
LQITSEELCRLEFKIPEFASGCADHNSKHKQCNPMCKCQLLPCVYFFFYSCMTGIGYPFENSRKLCAYLSVLKNKKSRRARFCCLGLWSLSMLAIQNFLWPNLLCKLCLFVAATFYRSDLNTFHCDPSKIVFANPDLD